MAYEVIKKRGKRAYRYRVEYVRDSQGRARTHWQYLGAVADAVEQACSIQPRAKMQRHTGTTERLLDALERLLTRTEYAAVTAGAIASEAGVAHGTFYRYFDDKRDALRAAMQRMSERVEHLATIDAPTASREHERRRVRDWLHQKLTATGEFPGIWRAWSALSQSDPAIAEVRRTLRSRHITMMELYIAQLALLGHTPISDANAAARAIFALMYGIVNDRFSDHSGLPPREVIDQAAKMVDLLIFAERT